MNRENINRLLEETIVEGVIEGFGVVDQTEFIQIKNSDCYRIDIQSYIKFNDLYVSNGIYGGFFKYISEYNLKEIKEAYCNEKGAFTLLFNDGNKIVIGEKQDEENFYGEESWQFSTWEGDAKIIVNSILPEAEYIVIGEW